MPFICPEDRAALRQVGSRTHQCSACQREYPLDSGVLRLLPGDDEFYEGAYQNHVAFVPRTERRRHAWPLWLINGGYIWSVRKHVPAGACVVELGCAAGVRYFGEHYEMIGCDLSGRSLRRLEHVYSALLQVDAARCIPLPDASADAVISSYFWEHVPPSLKPRLLRECARVLRPGGKVIFLYDLETSNPLISHYRRKSPPLYRKLFIDADGHVGYQTSADNAALFEAAGFCELETTGLEKTPFQSASVYEKLAEFGGPARGLFRAAIRLGQRPLFYPYTALCRLLDTAVAPWLPADWARIELVVWQRPERDGHRRAGP